MKKTLMKKGYPASTTKIMTALVVLDLCRQYDISIKEKVKIPKGSRGRGEGSSLCLKAGETKTIEDCCTASCFGPATTGLQLWPPSWAGTRSILSDLMNEKAEALGCTGTHFVNPSGLSDEEHYITARDLSTIARCAMEKKTFRKVVKRRAGRNIPIKNKTVFQYEGATGIK